MARNHVTGIISDDQKKKGVYAKCKTSTHKHSKLYVKKYRGQGR